MKALPAEILPHRCSQKRARWSPAHLWHVSKLEPVRTRVVSSFGNGSTHLQHTKSLVTLCLITTVPLCQILNHNEGNQDHGDNEDRTYYCDSVHFSSHSTVAPHLFSVQRNSLKAVEQTCLG